MAAGDMKRARQAVSKEMKSIKAVATARSRALRQAITELQTRGTKGVPKVLSTHGKHFTPEETAMLRNATDEDIERLVDTHKMLRDLHSTMECI